MSHKIIIEKAQAFEIDPAKHYIVTFESTKPLTQEHVEIISKGIKQPFDNAGAKCDFMIMAEGKSVKIAEVKK